MYTRRGDHGRTQLLSGETVEKDDLRQNTLGTLDELQSHLGMAKALLGEDSIRSMLHVIQNDIATACTEVASTPRLLPRLKRRIDQENVTRIERWIDETAASYGSPGHFVVPGASRESAALHVARTVCRRSERLIVTLNRQARVYNQLIAYFNRLADLLFELAWMFELLAAIESVLDNMQARSSR